MSKLEDKKVLKIGIGVMIGVLTVALWGYSINQSFQSAIGENNEEVAVVDAEAFSESEKSIHIIADTLSMEIYAADGLKHAVWGISADRKAGVSFESEDGDYSVYLHEIKL